MHLPTGEKVAVKVLMQERIKTSADRERVAREIKILHRLHHPNIAELFEVIHTQNHILLVMEHVPDGELFGYIVKHKRLSESVACRLLHDIVDGLDYLHRNGVSHRDLKPENILLQRKPTGGYRCKLIDFGLGNTFRTGQMLKTACGSPCYAAPELVRNVPCESSAVAVAIASGSRVHSRTLRYCSEASSHFPGVLACIIIV